MRTRLLLVLHRSVRYRFRPLEDFYSTMRMRRPTQKPRTLKPLELFLAHFDLLLEELERAVEPSLFLCGMGDVGSPDFGTLQSWVPLAPINEDVVGRAHRLASLEQRCPRFAVLLADLLADVGAHPRRLVGSVAAFGFCVCARQTTATAGAAPDAHRTGRRSRVCWRSWRQCGPG